MDFFVYNNVSDANVKAEMEVGRGNAECGSRNAECGITRFWVLDFGFRKPHEIDGMAGSLMKYADTMELFADPPLTVQDLPLSNDSENPSSRPGDIGVKASTGPIFAVPEND